MIKHWILLRGLSREQRHWGVFPELLRQACPLMSFHTLDLPGTGDCLEVASPTTVAGIRRHLQDRVEAEGIAAPLGVIGLSLGGMVALDWMAQDDSVAAVVVINTSAGNCPLHWRLRPGALAMGLGVLLQTDLARRERMILRMGSRRYGRDENTIRQWIDIQRQRPVAAKTFLRQLLAAAGFSLPRNSRHVPGLVLTSSHDTLVSPACSERIAKYYQWPLRCEPGAGHDLPLDAPVWVVQQICNWLKQNNNTISPEDA